MADNYISMEDIAYINIGYILSQLGLSRKINDSNVSLLKNEIAGIIPCKIVELLVVDLDNIVSSYEGIESKASYLKTVFEEVEKRESVKSILFANCNEENASFLREKDFPDTNKICVMSFDYESGFLRAGKNVAEGEVCGKIKKLVFGSDTTAENKDGYLSFVNRLISRRIKAVLTENNCIEDIQEREKHILSSTPVHVNKYVNLKPLLEKHIYFQEICYLLYSHIVNKCSTPDYIVASSRNSIYIASGLMKYFKTANMIIVDQVSPVTKLSNFSNLEDVRPNRTYAIIEDFCCMGTEIKTVKSVLWSRGVDVEQDCYVFPIVSTNLYGEKTNEVFKTQRIHPLYILGKSDDYLMFTSNCCPVCNGIGCEHSKKFHL